MKIPMLNIFSPSPYLLALEPFQTMCDYVAGHTQLRDLSSQGDGHPVLVLPGLGTSGSATADLRIRLKQLGYAVNDWNQGFNQGPGINFDFWLSLLGTHLQEIHAVHQRPISIIGWSLGGTYARELAKLHPELVRQVITLATPFANPNLTVAEKMFSGLSGIGWLIDESLLLRLSEAPPVPSTSIYSQTDVVVDWQSCRGDESTGHRNIEVNGVSHYGMVYHPDILTAIALLLKGTHPDY
jgi:alpha-beta hydrolase superfamily lysophospholipase